jgi:hypothetical protein
MKRLLDGLSKPNMGVGLRVAGEPKLRRLRLVRMAASGGATSSSATTNLAIVGMNLTNP